MSKRIKRTVLLTPELKQFVQERVANGRYETASDVVCAGLQLLVKQQQDRAAALAALKK